MNATVPVPSDSAQRPDPAPGMLQGRLVTLVPLSRSHVAALVEAASGDRATFALTHVPSSEAGALAYVQEALRQRRAGVAVPFAVLAGPGGRVVGSTRYLDLEYWDWPPGTGDGRAATVPSAVEIGSTWLAADVQRTGVNAEMKRLMLGYAFQVWQVHRVTLKTDARNALSRRAIERLGACPEGVRRAHHPATDGTIRDTAYYSILRSEWLARAEEEAGAG